MPQSNPSRLRHLLITGTANTEFYTSPATGGGSKSKLPPRQRQAHGQILENLDRYIQTAGPVRPLNWQSEVISPYTLSLAGGVSVTI